MREFWLNVYKPEPGVDMVGAQHSSVIEANENACRNRVARLHVRLKPDGAPRRYASEANRRAWEKFPNAAKVYKAVGGHMCVEEDGAWWVKRFEG
jgi:acyl-coenzyme A synthetase/AMP-(fatty) acid ligase